jgi:hypothetical protein
MEAYGREREAHHTRARLELSQRLREQTAAAARGAAAGGGGEGRGGGGGDRRGGVDCEQTTAETGVKGRRQAEAGGGSGLGDGSEVEGAGRKAGSGSWVMPEMPGEITQGLAALRGMIEAEFGQQVTYAHVCSRMLTYASASFSACRCVCA